MMLFTLPGTPMFYAGDELGMSGGSINAEQILDPSNAKYRDMPLTGIPNARRCSADGSAHAGFTTGTPWLPVACDYVIRNVQIEHADGRSMLNLYRRLIALRRAEPALATGGYTTVQVCDDIFVYARNDHGRRILIALNLSSRAQSCQLPGAGGGRLLLSTHLGQVAETVSDEIELGSDEGVIIAVVPEPKPSVPSYLV
jgi:alpha-glucosidase